MKKLILFVGGHHNSTLEVAKAAKRKGYKVLWFGHKYNLSNNKTISAEYKEVRQEGFSFVELTTGRFYKKFNLKEAILIAVGFVQSLFYLVKYKPRLIFSSGGYLAVPVVITGFFLGIPSVTHEQTVVAGWANKALIPFTKRIFLTYEDQFHQFPSRKSVVTGLPLNSFLTSVPRRRLHQKRKTVFITTGKQGSEIINNALFPLLSELTKKYFIVHQTGPNSLSIAQNEHKKLGHLSRNYLFSEYFFAKDQARYLKNSDLVISRAGAHTIFELVALGKNAIVIPIPWVSHNEQLKNAQYAKTKINCVVLNEKELSPDVLKKAIDAKIHEKPATTFIKNQNNATEKIFRELEKMALV